MSESRPKWAFVLDEILNHHASREAGAIRHEAQINSFLQNWEPSTSHRSSLSKQVKSILKTAKRYNVSFAAIKLDRELKLQLPVWYHIGAEARMRRLNNTQRSDCLRLCHGVQRLADLSAILADHGPDTALNDEQCTCSLCMSAVENGCRDPSACYTAAKTILDLIRPKWHPSFTAPRDGLSLTRRRREVNETALLSEDSVTFDPSVTSRGNITEAFRAFVDTTVHDAPPAIRRRPGRTVAEEAETVYLLDTKDVLKQAGRNRPPERHVGFAFFGDGDRRNTIVAQTLPEENEGNALGSILAALYAAETVPGDAPLHLVS
ncbi:uncharacterized protein B0H18DRAFT_891831, partial [Fomitopsis serialis]|uniref:uncharacterized protein n=1 Tax=Fomitopsis serialis TaxID=139415 RepID=UPI002008761D